MKKLTPLWLSLVLAALMPGCGDSGGDRGTGSDVLDDPDVETGVAEVSDDPDVETGDEGVTDDPDVETGDEGDTTVTPPGFVRIEPGTFVMGSPESELGRYSDENQHSVTLTRSFLLQTTEVTQEQWQAVMASNPSYFSDCGSNCPVESVSWYDAIAYANAESASEGLAPCYSALGEVIGGATVYDCTGYRLPTEAEWEYAARAGTTTASYGGELSGDPSSCDAQPSLESIAWYCGNSGDRTQAVGGKAANAWGLYDMLGNVWEWTWDWYGSYPGGAVTDPVGASSGSDRVLRGGGWNGYANYARAANHASGDPDGRFNDYGFRLARSLP